MSADSRLHHLNKYHDPGGEFGDEFYQVGGFCVNCYGSEWQRRIEDRAIAKLRELYVVTHLTRAECERALSLMDRAGSLPTNLPEGSEKP